MERETYTQTDHYKTHTLTHVRMAAGNQYKHSIYKALEDALILFSFFVFFSHYCTLNIFTLQIHKQTVTNCYTSLRVWWTNSQRGQL